MKRKKQARKKHLKHFAHIEAEYYFSKTDVNFWRLYDYLTRTHAMYPSTRMYFEAENWFSGFQANVIEYFPSQIQIPVEGTTI